MKKNKTSLLIIFILIITTTILYLTRPSEKDHKMYIKNTLGSLINKKINDELNTHFNEEIKDNKLTKSLINISNLYIIQLTNNYIDKFTHYKNYFIFSTTEFYYKNEWHIIAIGIFNKVYLVHGIEEKIENFDLDNLKHIK